MKITEKTLKRLIWFAVVPVAVVIAIYSLAKVAQLYNYFQRAQIVDTALHLVEPRRAERNRLTWLKDKQNSGRTMEEFSRDAISNDYMIAFEELAFSLYSNDQSGLESYFQSGALDDARLASSTPAEFVDWNHQLQLYFYSLDGGTVGFTDTFDYVQGVVRDQDLEDIRLARRKMQVILKLDDGNWRIHHWRTLSDEVITYPRVPFLSLQDNLSNVRGVRYIPRSFTPDTLRSQYDRAELLADFSTMSRLGFNTVEVPLAYLETETIIGNLSQLVELSSTYKIKVILKLFPDFDDYKLETLPRLLMYIDSLAEVLDHPTILAIRFDSNVVAPGEIRTGAIVTYLIHYVREITNKPILVSDPPLMREADAFMQIYDSPELVGTQNIPTLAAIGFYSNLISVRPQGQVQQAYLYQQALMQLREQKRGWILDALYDGVAYSAIKHSGILNRDGSAKESLKVFVGEPVRAPDFVDKVKDYRYLILILLGLLALGISGFWLFR